MEKGMLHIFGVDLQRPTTFPLTIFQRCGAIVVSNRFLPLLDQIHGVGSTTEIIPIAPLAAAIDRIKVRLLETEVAVLASGDPLFFGIGRRLIDTFGRDCVRTYPVATSLQHTFARFGISWDDASFVSLHGRKPENILGTLLANTKTGVLTDSNNRPETIASWLYDFLGNENDITMYVAENLGLPDERLISGTVQQVAEMTFGDLCCVLLVRAPSNLEYPLTRFGLREEDIIHSRGLITKNEVRAAAIHALQIPDKSVFWDVGAGSGSIGLEVARMLPGTLVYAIEKEIEQHANIIANKKKYGVFNLHLIEGEAPEKLYGLPQPQRIFIGGSGGNLNSILSTCAEALSPGGRIVVSAVLEKTAIEAPQLLLNCDLQVDIHHIAVSRTSYPDNRQKSYNPITLIVGQKSQNEDDL